MFLASDTAPSPTRDLSQNFHYEFLRPSAEPRETGVDRRDEIQVAFRVHEPDRIADGLSARRHQEPALPFVAVAPCHEQVEHPGGVDVSEQDTEVTTEILSGY